MIGFAQLKCPRPPECTPAYCSNRGKCLRIPYSFTNFCFCFDGYTGNRCERKAVLKKINDVMGLAIQIPQLADVHFAVKDLTKLMSAEFLKTRDLIESVEMKLEKTMKALEDNVGKQIEWSQLLAKYYDSVKNLNNVMDVDKDMKTGNTHVNSTSWASYVLKVDGIQMWLKQFHKMMSGKDTTIFGGEPLMIQLMKKR